MLSTFQPHDGKKKQFALLLEKLLALMDKARGCGIMFQGLNAV